jgi:glucokinase
MFGGLDLGGTKVQAVVVDAELTVIASARRATPACAKPAEVVRALVAGLEEAARSAGIDARTLAGVGIGAPGVIDGVRGTLRGARNLPGFEGEVPLAPLLEAELGVRTVIGNDVGLAVDAEARLGAGRGLSSFLGVWWGTGVGGGVVLHGKRWLGRGAAGEIGHTIVRRGGALCPCGRRGCVEAYAGRQALELRARKAQARGSRTRLFEWMEAKGGERLTSGVWAKALRKRDPLATRLIERAVEALGVGIASSVNLLDVEAIVIGGGLGTRLGPECAELIAAAMLPHLFVPSRPPRVQVTELGDLGGAIGAGMLALDASLAAAQREAAP